MSDSLKNDFLAFCETLKVGDNAVTGAIEQLVCEVRDGDTQLAARDRTIAELRERIAELEALFRHTHKALYDGGELKRICATCRLDLTDPIHHRAGETP